MRTVREEIDLYLASDNPREVAHGRKRLALLESEPPPAPKPARPRYVPLPPRPACEFREACGCEMPQCLHAGNGPKFGTAESQLATDNSRLTVYRVSADACRACGGVRTAPPPPAPEPAAALCAVVIPCHNYGHWLGEAVESVLAQTRPASEIVVVDDSSSDDTRAVTGSFKEQGVRYIRIDAGSVWEARKAGFLATESDTVCFLDADDTLPPDYLERGMPLFGARTGVVYTDYENFGDSNGRSDYPTFDRGRLECENFMHAGSLFRRRAAEIAGAFDGPRPINTFADWFLWRKLADAGFSAAKSPALYRYRRHGASMILASNRAAVPYHVRANLRHEAVTIVCPLSGRDWAWPRYRDWLEAQTWPRGQCALLILDTGPTAGVREWVAGCDYPDSRYVRLDVGRKGLAGLDRRAHVAEVRLAMSRIYNKAFRGLETPLAFVLEDDVVPPDDVIARLTAGFDKDVAAVSGAYPSRFHPHYVAWDKENRSLAGGEGLQDIGGIGFGCVLLRRCVVAGETFASLPGESDDYDLCHFARLRKAGWRLRVDWNVKADHRSPPEDVPTPRTLPPNVVDAGHGVFIGDWQACDAHGAGFPLRVHVVKQSNIDGGVACRGVTGGDDGGLTVMYSEGEPLSTMSVPIAAVAAYLRRPGDCLIHCGAGQCRSPTLAVLAKVARGASPWDAIRDVWRATWEGRHFSPSLFAQPMNEILLWWESERRPPTTD